MTIIQDLPATQLRPIGPAPVPADRLRRTLRRQAAGVTVITVPGPAGFTATSFTSVSLDPALVSFYVSATASAAPAVRAAAGFAVHILGRGQEELAARFARSGVDRFAGTDWTPDELGTPVLAGVAAWLTARPVLLQEVGDHLLVVGEVVDTLAREDVGPLVHHDGAFGGFTSAPGAGARRS
ncbi:flavin-dependent reductase [Kitasatospora herbaricolor]|uniref:flavin reductase family protein n=1 Tax=Kitasatospora herbaricolor TaxID=68217 RepID=UPI00174859CD|nr:flavin reductase family protein [Kitasatospora herbaricolor]MDQ0313248.1 flavin reductase (DIM6/NTAB) family NADH-FMN oxidoreductase RutF [Kitasatospora herbaricolor]GGV20262.1 flavin-dependent reductase [Kitasatospora herbaricolor]